MPVLWLIVSSRVPTDSEAEADVTQERVVLREHEVYLARERVWHGDSVFIGDDEYGECWILDVFSPPRDDLRNG